jgi:hypothetical protein
MTQLAPTDVCKTAGAASSNELVPIDEPALEPGPALVGALPVAIAFIAVGIVGLARRAR